MEDLSIPQEIVDELEELDNKISKLTVRRKELRVKYKVGTDCCQQSSSSNGWHHNQNCDNYVIGF